MPLRFRDLELKKGKGKESEALVTRGRSDKQNTKGSSRGRSKTQGKVKKCFYCHKEGHIRKTAMNSEIRGRM